MTSLTKVEKGNKTLTNLQKCKYLDELNAIFINY